MTSGPLETASTRFLASLPVGEDGKPYPVESWNPGHCGSSFMRIDAEGRWYHEGTLIPRPAMVALFARLLRREADGSHVLVTPAEKLTIEVEDAPLIATELRSEGAGETRQLAFHIAHFGWTVASADHPLTVDEGPTGPTPSVLGPRGLRARLARPVYYEVIELALAEAQDGEPVGLWSGGQFFPLDAAGAGPA